MNEANMEEYEIWVGYYNLGQGMSDPVEPEMLGKECSIDFETACLKFELKRSLEEIEIQEKQGYVNDQSKVWFYNEKKNSNGWTGKYYQSREQALESFKK
jgi:hypothetical protein